MLDTEHRQRQLAGYNPVFLAGIEAKRKLAAGTLTEPRAAMLLREANEAKAEALAQKKAKAERRAEVERKVAADAARRNGMPDWVKAIVAEVCAARGRQTTGVFGRSAMREDVAARHEVFYRIKQARPTLSSTKIAGWFGRDRTTIIHSIAKHASVSGLPNLGGYDIERASRNRLAKATEYSRRRKEAKRAALQEKGE